MSEISGGRAVVEYLLENKIKIISGIIGSSFMEIYDALYDTNEIQYINVRHEANGVALIDGLARYTNRPQAFLSSQAGPGVSNTVSSMAQAMKAFSPVVNIGGAVSTNLKNMDGFQELNQRILMQAVTKQVYEAKSISEIPGVLNQAFSTAASPRKGPVHIDLPRDILSASAIFGRMERYTKQTMPNPDPNIIKKIVHLLLNSKKPAIIVGAGIKNGGDYSTQILLKLAEKLNAPIATSPGHSDCIPSNHKLYVGVAGPRGLSGLGTELLKKADLILSFSRLGFNTTFFSHENINKDAKIIQILDDEESLGRYFPNEVSVLGDATTVAEKILNELKSSQVESEVMEWTKMFQDSRSKYLKERDEEVDYDSSPMVASGIFSELRKVIPKQTAMTFDVGSLCLMCNDSMQYYQSKSCYSPLDFALMGGSYGLGLGVKLANPSRPVVSFMGDASASMIIPELATAKENNINTVLCIFQNNIMAAERAYTRDYFNSRFYGSSIENPDFVKVAEAYNCNGFQVRSVNEISEAMEAAFKSEKPSVVVMDVDDKIMMSFRTDSFKNRKNN